ncbi:hypothetical protein QYF61_027921 [Mycteria americana]|uniref:Uncharacterized protein n=1 Tax=Mycteria americana TaxID=33587 RepID=A0AAN7NK08_MYCAM|nr:hypothetical protein QYF61_027921 [Mycteria americana]
MRKPSTTLLKAPLNLTLNTCNDGSSTASLGDLFLCLTNLIALLKVSLHLSYKPLLHIERLQYDSPEPSLLQAEQPQLSQPFFIAEPRIQLAFWAARGCCQLMSNFLSPSILKPFSTGLLSIHSFPSLCRSLHLALLNFMRFTWAHSSSLSRSLWMTSLPSSKSTALLSLVSSANLLRVHSIPLSVSLMKTLNSTHPTIDYKSLDVAIKPTPYPSNGPEVQSPGTSPDCHDFSNIVESGLATALANSQRTLGCIWSGPMGLHMFRFLRNEASHAFPENNMNKRSLRLVSEPNCIKSHENVVIDITVLDQNLENAQDRICDDSSAKYYKLTVHYCQHISLLFLWGCCSLARNSQVLGRSVPFSREATSGDAYQHCH